MGSKQEVLNHYLTRLNGGFCILSGNLLILLALQDSNIGHITLVIKAFFSVRKTPEPPIRPPIVFR
ncbi:hypothetical protein GBM01_03280 [Yersinia pseudotuberculosis]|nr:hypothetical protein [Yersinia pseudotuberculosis]